SDVQAAPAGSLTSGPTCPDATLAPTVSETCTGSYTVTQADLDHGKLVDTATATGTPPTGPPITSPPSTVTINGAGVLAISVTPTPPALASTGPAYALVSLWLGTIALLLGMMMIALGRPRRRRSH
ncbi:MAG: hypothetical protein ABI232_01305, partial [Jatrophihabitantaceae bacterium]